MPLIEEIAKSAKHGTMFLVNTVFSDKDSQKIETTKTNPLKLSMNKVFSDKNSRK